MSATKQDVVRTFLQKGMLPTPEEVDSALRSQRFDVVLDYKQQKNKKQIGHFVDVYNKRFEFLRNEIAVKMDAAALVSIKNASGRVGIIGMVRAASPLIVEDPSGSIKIEADAKLMEDEIVGIVGVASNGQIKAEHVIHPDVPLTNKPHMAQTPTKILFTNRPFVGADVIVYTGSSHPNLQPDVWPNGAATIKGNPVVLNVAGVRVLIFHGPSFASLSQKLDETDPKKILIRLVRARHLEPFEYKDGDPLLLKDIPDVICMDMGTRTFVNYKGITIISPGDGGYLVDLVTRETTVID